MAPKEFTGKTKWEVKQKLDEYKLLIQTGEYVSPKITVEQYAVKFLEHKSSIKHRTTRGRIDGYFQSRDH